MVIEKIGFILKYDNDVNLIDVVINGRVNLIRDYDVIDLDRLFSEFVGKMKSKSYKIDYRIINYGDKNVKEYIYAVECGCWNIEVSFCYYGYLNMVFYDGKVEINVDLGGKKKEIIEKLFDELELMDYEEVNEIDGY